MHGINSRKSFAKVMERIQSKENSKLDLPRSNSHTSINQDLPINSKNSVSEDAQCAYFPTSFNLNNSFIKVPSPLKGKKKVSSHQKNRRYLA